MKFYISSKSKWIKDKNKLYLLFIFILSRLGKNLWAINAIFKYDIFIFGFGQSLLRSNLDLPILKLFGKKIISNLCHGSEARPPYIDGAIHSRYGKKLSLREIAKLAKINRRLVKWHEKFSRIGEKV